jgi:hypothetical protein
MPSLPQPLVYGLTGSVWAPELPKDEAMCIAR